MTLQQHFTRKKHWYSARRKNKKRNQYIGTQACHKQQKTFVVINLSIRQSLNLDARIRPEKSFQCCFMRLRWAKHLFDMHKRRWFFLTPNYLISALLQCCGHVKPGSGRIFRLMLVFYMQTDYPSEPRLIKTNSSSWRVITFFIRFYTETHYQTVRAKTQFARVRLHVVCLK